MKAKKNKAADLEKKRFAFFQVGLILVTSAIMVAFEYTSVEERMAEAEQYDAGPLIIPTWTEIDETPVEERNPNLSHVLTPPNPGVELIDSVDIVQTPIDPGKGIFVPVDPGFGDPVPPVVIVDPGPIIPEPIYDVTSVYPSFPGGDGPMHDDISGRIRYPQTPFEMGIQGTVYVEFVINTDGSICQVVAKNKVDPELEKEAIRVVSTMPRWIPGEQNGKKVRTRFVIPIRFTIK